MHHISTTRATGAPPASCEALRRRRILAHAGLPPALAGAVAEIAFGADRRDHGALLASLTDARTAAAGAVRL